MWRLDLTDVFGMLTGIILGLGFFALVAFLVYLFVYKRIKMNHEMRLELIKQGRDLPAEGERYGSLKAGIVLMAVGGGFLLAMLFESYSSNDDLGGELVLAFVPLLCGLGLAAFHFIARAGCRNGNGGHRLARYSSESLDS